MFFGLGCALTLVVALNYFQSMIIPQTFVGWIYFLTTFVGQYGLIISLVYFLIYCPVILIFPSYYVSRIWSIFLILSINLLIFFDSYLFTRYRFHLNSFLWNFLQDRNALPAFGLTPFKLGLIVFVTLIVFFVLWLRGERLWRTMQLRFRNPVQNWYLVFIFICFTISHLMYMYGDAKGSRHITRLSNLFPVYYPLTAKDALKERGIVGHSNSEKNQGYKDFYYPAEKINCAMKSPKNILLIVLDEWSENEMNPNSTPNLYHYSTHGLLFQNHYSGGLNAVDGYFSLMYSLPPTYTPSVLNQSTEPVFLSQMKKSNFDISFYNLGRPSPLTKFLPEEKEVFTDYIDSHLNKRDELTMVNPFFMQVFLEGGTITGKDMQVKTIIDQYIQHEQIENTIIVLTGSHSVQTKTPLIVIWPGKKAATISQLTTHYDVVPSIMSEDWKCKNKVSEYSFGKNIFSKHETEIHVAGNYDMLKILNTKDETLTSLNQSKGIEVRDLGSMSVNNEKRDISAILNVLKSLTVFYKHR